MAGITSVSGLVTGLDTAKIVEGLLSIDLRRVELLKNKQSRFTQRQTAFKSLEARLLTLQEKAARLARSQNGAFDAKSVTSSNESLIAAAASASAVPGVYTLRVNSLARAHQIASQGFDSPNAIISQGTIQLQLGSGATTTITVDDTNNTLQGLASAINASGAGVTATVVNDGSDGRTQPYRLLLTAKQAGRANAISITDGLAADGGGAIKPVLTGTSVGPAVTGAGYTGTSTPTADGGAGLYTGTTNNTYRFTVVTGGTVGTDEGIQLSYADRTGANQGTLTLGSADTEVFKDVAQGVRVKFAAGTLVEGETFTIDAFVPTVQEAVNASASLGSGGGALNVESDSNQIDGVIQGVTLNLVGADSGREVTLTVKSDTERARQDVLDFVEAYNDLLKFVEEVIRFDAETGKAAVLQGDRSVALVREQVRRAVTDVIPGANPQLNHVGALGITANSQGLLEVNQARLDDTLAGRRPGVSLEDVRRLFALAGRSTNPGVEFVTGSARTRSSATPYLVDLSQAARRAVVTATNPLAASTVINDTNNTLTVTVDGKASGPLTLTAGTYTRLALAQELEARIKADAGLTGRRVSVSLSGDRLVLTSQAYGFSSEVRIGTGTALAPLGLAGTEGGRGQDVVGKFVVNGVDETAVGTGQFLAGSATNANTADLQVRVTLGPNQVVEGPEAELTVTHGIAARLGGVLSGLLDPVSGRLKAIHDGFQTNVDDLQKAIDRQNQATEARRQALLRQFVALETSVGRLKATGDFLAAQLASLNALRQK